MKTPEHLKELREIRRKLSKEYLKNPKKFLEQANAKAKEYWHKEAGKKKAA